MAYLAIKTEREAREELYQRFSERIEVNRELDRRLVTFQANKSEPLYRWFKYKEGFSSAFVRYCLRKLSSSSGMLLDPFAGAGAALFASRDMGWNGIGIELLPVGLKVIKARLGMDRVSAAKLQRQLKRLEQNSPWDRYDNGHAFNHIPITRGAFVPDTEKQLSSYRAYCERSIRDPSVRELFDFAAFSVLEEVSYTRKDGQYLRWDRRAGKKRTSSRFDKGLIPTFSEAIRRKLRMIAQDVATTHNKRGLFGPDPARRGQLDVRLGSCLEILPKLLGQSIDFVLTSPPYCNRYDYTRTYALELAFLGYNAEEVKKLRQEMLSCTVENKEKVAELKLMYDRLGQQGRFRRADSAFKEQAALLEVLHVLERKNRAGKLNNNNIPRMIRNYFYEMSFVVLELSRVLKPGGKVVMVNDNVRYAGEELPVDLILSDFAGAHGLDVAHIWTLPRGKGNSSQQMGNHGRRELRKCVYVWEKPLT